MRKLIFIIFNILLGFGVEAQILNNNPGFEDGTFLNEWRLSNQNTDDSKVELVSSPTRSGNYALHLQHQYISGSTHNRCEVVPDTHFGGSPASGGYFPWHEEFWIGFSVYLYNWETQLGPWNSILQMHGIPADFAWGVCGAPPNAFSISSDDGFFGYGTIHEPNFNITTSIIENPYRVPDVEGAVVTGVPPAWWTPVSNVTNGWTDIVGNFIISPDGDGKMKWWINGVLQVDLSGPNTFAFDRCGNMAEEQSLMQLGSYKASTNTNLMDQYYDEIRFGDSSASYEDVAPGGNLPVNSPPILASVGNWTVSVGNVVNVPLSAIDADGDAMRYSISPDLGFVTLSDNQDGTGSLSISPGIGDIGTFNLDIVVTDVNNRYDSDLITIVVNDGGQGNSSPILSPIGNKTLTEGSVLNVSLSSSDLDGDARGYSISPNFGFITLTDNQDGTGTLRIEPKIGDTGVYNLTVIVTDSYSGSDSETFTITVNNGNSAPSLSTIGDKTVSLGNFVNVSLSASDTDGDVLSFNITPDLEFVSLNDNGDGTGILTISPVYEKPGIYNLTISVTDTNNGVDSETFSVTINDGMISSYALRINSGGPTVIFGNSDLQEDQFFNGGTTYVNSEPIAMTENDELYQSERNGVVNYDIPLPANGKYTIRLHFAEIYHIDGEAGSRIFDVDVENGQATLDNYDINAEVGSLTATVKTFTGIEVMDGKMSINLSGIVDEPKISGIEIFSELQLTTGIDSEIDDNTRNFSIYPNPSEGRFTIDLAEYNYSMKDIPVVIYDMTGKIVNQSYIHESRADFDLSGKNEGVYIIRIGNYKTKKIFLY